MGRRSYHFLLRPDAKLLLSPGTGGRNSGQFFAGFAHLPPQISISLVVRRGGGNKQQQQEAKMRELDRHELQALQMFANGKSADEMAQGLGVSKSIAQHYLRVAARKLEARNRIHAVAIAVKMGLIEPKGGPRGSPAG
jgi:DNA-binding NarL/FixJ family response regulator